MDNVQYTLAVVAFDGKDTAKDAMKAVKKAKKSKGVKVVDAVAVKKDEKGKVKLVQGKELTATKGATGFGIAGLVAGTLLGGPLAGAAIGAAIGGATGAKVDKGFDNKTLVEIGNEIDDNTSLLVLLLEDYEIGTLQDEVEEFGGKIYGFMLAQEGLVALGAATEDEAFLAVIESESVVVDLDEESEEESEE